MGLPDLGKYHQASHLTRIDWHCHEATKDCVSLETDMSPIPLKYSPWRSYPLSLQRHSLTGNTLKIFMATNAYVTSSLSPLTPLKDNPDFTPGIGNPAFQPTHQSGTLLAGGCFTDGKLKTQVSIKEGTDLPHMPLWAYLQLCSYLGGKTGKENFHRPLRDLKSICQEGTQFIRACLLHVTNFPLKKYKHSLLKYLLNVAKSLIPIHWKDIHEVP